MHRFLLHGLVVDSPVELSAGPAPGTGTDPAWRIELRRGPVQPVVGSVTIEADDPLTTRHYAVARDDASWTVTFPQVAAVRLRDGAQVLEVVADPTTPDGLLSVLLGGPAIAGLALVRGMALLHASAVAWGSVSQGPAPVVAFVGPSGAGKSSLARLLARDERTLFSDDALRVEPVDGRIATFRGTVGSRLRGSLDLPGDPTAQERRSADGRRVVTDSRVAPATGTLALAVAPRLSPGFPGLAARRLTAVQATAVLAASWPVDGVRDGALLSRRLEVAARLARALPVLSLDVPWPGGPAPGLADRLVQLLGEELDARRVVGG